jgi:3-oxoacid CoA-transferase
MLPFISYFTNNNFFHYLSPPSIYLFFPAFYTPTAAGTIIADGGFPIKYKNDGSGDVEIYAARRETREFNGVEYVMEEAIHGDVSLIKAWKVLSFLFFFLSLSPSHSAFFLSFDCSPLFLCLAYPLPSFFFSVSFLPQGDTRGNLVFRGTARNFNPDAAKAGKICIAEVEELVEAGEIHPDEVHLSGVYVDKIILATNNEKRIEKVTEKLNENNATAAELSAGRLRIMKRAAKEFKDGMYVNLGK